MNIVFFGTPDFASPFLKELIEDKDINVLSVIAQPDKPSGRGGKLKTPSTIELAQKHGIETYQFKSLKSENAFNQLSTFDADLFIVVAYGKLIPKSILDLPKKGCVNVHPSLLPEYRGPSPMQWAIKEGDDTTGVSIMLLDEGMDTGPLLSFETIELDGKETYTTLQQKVHAIGPKLLTSTMKRYLAQEIHPAAQVGEASLTSLLSKEDGHIDWQKSSVEIERMSRAFTPWPGIWSMWNREDKPMRLKFLSLKVHDTSPELAPGQIYQQEGRLFIDTANGSLEILKIQPEGKPAMDAKAFMTGYGDIDGSILT